MNQYYVLALAAQELAHTNTAISDKELRRVLNKYGIFLDSMTEDEFSELERLINDYA